MPGKAKLFIGVDVGGTKVFAAVVNEGGGVLSRGRIATPRGDEGAGLVAAICERIDEVCRDAGIEPTDAEAIGLGVPGVIDVDAGRIVIAPNLNLADAPIVSEIRRRYAMPVFLGNDVNLGVLGEWWLGAARDSDNVVGLFPGTGIGGGIIFDGKLVRGCREVAGELGHMIIQIGGPQCGCGVKGCLEALASRRAIERDIRAAVKKGEKTRITEWLKGDLSIIKSKVLRRALKEGDPLVKRVLTRAAEVMGMACINIRHFLDPDAIVLGGGLIEACGDFMLPIVETMVSGDPLKGTREAGAIRISALGDDAVVLGAVAHAQQAMGLKPAVAHRSAGVGYPLVRIEGRNRILVAGEPMEGDFYVRGDGEVKSLNASEEADAPTLRISLKQISRVCRGGPGVVFVGNCKTRRFELTAKAARFVAARNIDVKHMVRATAVRQFNEFRGRKALIAALAPPTPRDA